MELTAEIVFALIQSTEKFSIDFDQAWQWVGYTRKAKAKDRLERNFDRDVDYIKPNELASPNGEASWGGHNREVIYLTVDCFKSFCMMAGTQRGKEVRRYFLNCEAELRRKLEEEKRQSKQRVVNAVVAQSHTSWKKRFEDEFFEEAYRVTGWQPPSSGHPPCMAQFINETIYSYFPDGTQERLDVVNPRVKGKRKRKQHQHLTPELGIPVLDSRKAAVIAVMRLSPANNRNQFRQNMQKALSNVVQIELPFMDDDQVS